MSEVSTIVGDVSGELLSFRGDYEKRLQEIEAVPEAQLLPINVPIPSATQTVLGAIEEIRSLRPRLLEELPKFDIARFDKLESYSRAAYHAHSLYLIASTPPEAVPALVEECSNVSSTFRADAEALIRRGLLDGNALRNLRGTTAYRDVALDLYNLVQVLRANWSKIEGKTAIQLQELNKAEALSNRLTLALGAREQAPALAGPAALTRQRAYTLFLGTYSEVRRAITYLEPDKGDEIAPNVYVPRGPGKKKAEVDVSAPLPAAPAATPQPAQPAVGTPGTTPPGKDGPYTA